MPPLPTSKRSRWRIPKVLEKLGWLLQNDDSLESVHEWTGKFSVLTFISEIETESGQMRSQTPLYILIYGIFKLKMCLKTAWYKYCRLWTHPTLVPMCADIRQLTPSWSRGRWTVAVLFCSSRLEVFRVVRDATLVTQYQLRRWNRTYFMEIMFFPLSALLHVSVINWVPWWTDSFAYC